MIYKNILITGVCGSIGTALLEYLIKNNKNLKITGIDINEEKLFFLLSKYKSKKINFLYCDIKDQDSLNKICSEIDIIFHTAALKHVIFCEQSPNQGIDNNILGLNNLIKSAHLNKVKKFIFTSSDKAVNPTSVMGTTKLLGEKLTTSANIAGKKTVFASVRFGNVLGSSGSFIPIFKKQILNNESITITDKQMTRFVMTISEAVHLIVHSSKIAKGGEVFVFKMPAVNIDEAADAMIDLYSPQLNKSKKIYIGSRPGEKLYEELLTNEEIRRTNETSKYFIISPPFTNIYNYKINSIKKNKIKDSYNSSNTKLLSKNQIKKLIKKIDIDNKTINISNTKINWPG